MRFMIVSLLAANFMVFAYFQFVSPSSVVRAEVVQPVKDNYKALKVYETVELRELTEQLAVVPSKAPAPVCTLVGPFPAILRAEFFVERLGALDVSAQIKSLTVPGELRYWVHLPPESSRKLALKTLRELQQKGVDSYVVPRGELVNGISLGIFVERKRALELLASIKASGYTTAAIREVARDIQQVWVWLPKGEAPKLSAKKWIDLLAQEENLQKRQNLCTDVASLSNIQ